MSEKHGVDQLVHALLPFGEIDERDLHDDRVYPPFQATAVVPSSIRTH
jgi:hypothetical protein